MIGMDQSSPWRKRIKAMSTIRILSLAGTGMVCAPVALAAHDGHGGHHGWLAGALQPLLSLDHLAAALFVVLVGAIGVVYLARPAGTRRNPHTPDPRAGGSTLR